MAGALPVTIITHNVGNVQSATNLLFLCGDQRYGVEGCAFFFHQTAFEAPPGQRLSASFVRERLKGMQYEDTRSAQIYASKTNRIVKDVRKWMNAKKVMDTAAAILNGLIQAVRPYNIPPNAFHHQVIVPDSYRPLYGASMPFLWLRVSLLDSLLWVSREHPAPNTHQGFIFDKRTSSLLTVVGYHFLPPRWVGTFRRFSSLATAL